MNVFRSGGIVKFYFSRFDPDMNGIALPNSAVFCQVVMPAGGFAAMTLFFQQQLETMIQKNEITREFIDQLRENIAAQAAQQAPLQTPQPQQGQSNAG